MHRLRISYLLPLLVTALLSNCGHPAASVRPDAQPVVAPVVAAKPAIPEPTTKPTTAPRPTATAESTGATGDVLYVRDGYGTDREQVAVVDTTTGTARHSLPNGVAAPDWSALYAVTRSAKSTTVQALAPATGQRLRALDVPGDWV